MKTTNNLLSNQNYTFSERLYLIRLKEIEYAKSRSQPSKIKNLILGIFLVFFGPYFSMVITGGKSEVLGMLIWLSMIFFTIVINKTYENSTKQLRTKKVFSQMGEELERQMWEYRGYIIHGKHNHWEVFSHKKDNYYI